MQIRLLLAGNLIFSFVAVSTIIVVLTQENLNFAVLSFGLTYSMLLIAEFSDLLYFFCGTEQRLVSVERIT